ncbi:histidine phosphatase family protein [Candidatus Saccharibacteria bacterium]|nr:histidine phosphatase family protein [Candidatus Saccharibacteria bacterium]
MLTIWFEPHATTIDNEAKQASGWKDVDLSELGKQQALEMIERNRGRDLDAIFCSDLQRAVKTVVPSARNLHIPMYPDERLRECDYGDMTGDPVKAVNAERERRVDIPYPNGESYRDCMNRMKSFYGWLRDNFDGKTVLIIGHRATHYGLDVWIEGKTLEDTIAEAAAWQWQPGWKYTV